MSSHARRVALGVAIAAVSAIGLLPAQVEAQGTPACTISWVGDVNDNWYGSGANGTNWTGDRIPNDQDFACLDNQVSPYTVRIAGGGLGGHTTNGFRIESDVTVVLDSGGMQPVSLTAREQPATNAGTIRMSGPSFLGSAGLTNTGTISIPAGGYQLPGNSSYERRVWGDVLNRGTISVGSPVASIGGRRSAAGVFYDGGPVETITNEGTIEVASGGKLKVFRAILKQTDTGLIRGPGEVNVTGAASETGNCQENSNNGAPATLRIEGGSIAPGADVDVQFCTELRFVSADDATGEIGVSPYVVSAGGSVGAQPTLYGDIPAGITLNIDSVGLNTVSRDSFGATVSLAENVTNRGSINLNGPGAWLRQRTDLAPGFTLTNRGTITVTAGGGPGPRTLGVTNIDNYGTVSIQHPDAALRGGLNNYETGSTSGGANYYESPPPGASTPIALTNRGELNVASGGALTVGYGSHFDNAWPVSLVHEDGGVVRGGGSVKVYGQLSTLRFSGGSSEIPTLMTRNADLAFSSEAGSSGHVNVAVDLAFGSGTNTQVTGTVPVGVSIDVESTLDRFNSQSSAQLAAAADWRNEGTIRLVNGGSTIDTAFSGTFTNAGTVTTAGSLGQPLRLLFGNTTNHGLIDVASPHNLIAGTISNASAGRIRVAAGAQASGTWNNAGTIELAGTMSGSLTQTAGSTELSGGPSPALNTAVTLQGGVIRGSGSIGNFVTNSGGTISPGIGGPGTLNIFDYTQTAGGTYAVDVAGTSPGSQFDQLVITNRVALNGTLAVDTTGFTPQQSDKFRIIDAPTPPQAPTRTGQFSNVTQTGYEHGVIYNPTNVELGFLPQCSDGRDNDSDGLTDFPQDNGCSSADDNSETTQCNDNADNDGDGDIDFPADAGCKSRSDDSENTESNPECSDEVDNDQNGRIDFPQDGGCESAQDNDESDPAPVYNPPADQRGMEDREKYFDLGYFQDPGSGSPWQVTVDWGDGSGPETFGWFYPDYNFGRNHTYADIGDYEVTVTVTEGDANPDSDSGTFNIEVTEFRPECSDSEDNDFDDNTDFPADPGCNSPDDDSERTESNPECSDERDNDGDGDVDFPADSACTDAGDNSEESNTATVSGPIVAEGDSGTTDAIFRITLSEPAREGASVQFDTGGYQAASGTDFQPVSRLVNFAEGEQSAEVRVPVIGDTLDEANEQFFASLSPGNRVTVSYTTGGRAYAYATIVDDDGAGNSQPAGAEDFFVTGAGETLTVDAPGVLANDVDIEGDELSATLSYQTYGGALTFNPDGSFTYAPGLGFTGSDYFAYYACDGTSCSNLTYVYIAVEPDQGDAPEANDDAVLTYEDESILIDVLANDTGNNLTIDDVSDPANGTAEVFGGQVRYTPDANFNGTDSFTYRACDDADPVRCSEATVTITVSALPDAPEAAEDSYSTDEDEVLSVNAPGVLGNDTDPEGDSLSAVLETGPANGELDLNPDGSFTYTPDADFNGSDSFTYRARAGEERSEVTTVTLTVRSVNDAPDADPDAYVTGEDTALSVEAPGVLAGDNDADNDDLTADLVSATANGDLDLNPDGSFTYSPDANFNGTDSFTYRACDDASPSECSDPATVTITVNSVNDRPVARDDSAATDEDASTFIDVLSNDTDAEPGPLTITDLSDPAHGTATVENGKVRYTPDADYSGPDSFTYRASDGGESSAPATVTINVRAVNDTPDANGDSAATDEDTPTSVNVLQNDTDVDSGALTISNVSDPANGTAVVENGQVRYSPDANFNGTDSFTYRACDDASPSECSDPATVTITVNSVNDRPVARDDSAATDEDASTFIDVLSNDTDAEPGPLTITDLSDPAHGTATVENGKVRYTPDADYSGPDSFTYRASDGGESSAPATVTINVRAVNDAPDANGDSAATDEDTPTSVNVLQNDTDVDSGALTISNVSDPANGTAVVENGQVRYSPDANFNGTDSFTYRACDDASPSECSDPATVTITVNAVNDAPEADNDSYGTDEDTELSAVAPGVLTGDTDADDDDLTASLVSGPANGTLDLNADGSFSYTPNANFSGTDSFTYRASDGDANSGVATVTITVRAVNDAPNGNADSSTLDEDTSKLTDVLANDTDVDSGQLTISNVSDPANGTAVVENGQVRYTPDPDYNGQDSFTYRACDNANPPACSAPTTVTITVNPVDESTECSDSRDNDSDGRVDYPADQGCDSLVDNSETPDPPECSDRLDNDSDGTMNFPNDQGCSSLDDNSEAPDAPECSDRLDNDGDGRQNFPADQGCESATDNSEAPDAPQCSDRLDNDNDGTQNFPADQGCDSNQDDSEAPDPPQCNDRLDNDGDGQNNFPSDQGCSSNDDNSEAPDPPQCSDRLDNDGDGKTNFPADQGCSTADDNSEAPDAPQCSDRLDNDNDGTTNFPADLGCESASDNSESPDPPQCSDRVDNDGDGKNNFPDDQGCDSAQDNSESPDPPECNDRLDNDSDGKTNFPADPGCSSANDNSESPDPPQCSDGRDNDTDGKIDFPADLGCDSANDNTESPDPPACNDRVDNDGDGRNNFPDDQGCSSASDNSESPDPPQCSDRLDNDGDGKTNFPADPGCESASDNSESPDPNTDTDSDGVLNTRDNCPTTPNPSQSDEDEDGIGDACDSRDNRSECKITDGGHITTRAGHRANFGANAHPGNPPKGQQNYQDHGPNGIDVKATSLTHILCSPSRRRATIKGLAKVDGKGSHEFRIDVTDVGEPGTNDTYRIRVGSYDSGERKLDGGNIQIHK